MTVRLIDVFPPGDRLALFVLAMTAAANDVDASDQEARAANDPPGTSDPDYTDQTRFTYHVRRSLGHLFEGIAALKTWRREDAEVRQLMRGLSKRGQARLKFVCGVEQRVGSSILRGVRNNSFHYPKPGTDFKPDPIAELADAIEKNPDVEASFFTVRQGGVAHGEDVPRPRRRYTVADRMMLAIAFGGYDPDKTTARKQLDLHHQAAEEFSMLIDELVDLYCKRREIRLTSDEN